jgi:hypothetical protein
VNRRQGAGGRRQEAEEYGAHRVQLMWYPAYGRWRLVCRCCGDVVEEFPEEVDFPYPGRCEPPVTLGVSVEDGVGTRDVFGGNDARGRKQEAGGKRQDARGRKQEARGKRRVR